MCNFNKKLTKLEWILIHLELLTNNLKEFKVFAKFSFYNFIEMAYAVVAFSVLNFRVAISQKIADKSLIIELCLFSLQISCLSIQCHPFRLHNDTCAQFDLNMKSTLLEYDNLIKICKCLKPLDLNNPSLQTTLVML